MRDQPPIGVFLGLISLDVASITDFPIPENKKLRDLPVTVETGGPAANAARAFAALGGTTRFAAFGSSCPISNALWSMYCDENTDISAIRLPGVGVPTIANTLISRANGDRSILANERPIADRYDVSSIPTEGARIALLDGYHFVDFLPVAQKLKAEGTYMVLDGGSWKSEITGHLDLFDCAILSNDFCPPNDEDPVKYLQARGLRNIIITNGGNMIRAYLGEETMTFYPPKAAAVDTLGAGDMFHGAFCYYYALSEDILGSAKMAADFASQSVTFFGLRSFFESF